MDALDQKLNSAFDGKVVRKDLLHRIKKGTNVPTFVLEFLLAKYCASNDPDEIQAGMEAVIATLQENYVRPNEANAAQSRVARLGKHRFIDKVHVRYVEKEKRHWAALENFDSQRIAINERFYKDTDRILEGGIWAEVTLSHNDIEEDDYAFYVEELRPIQLSKFDFDRYCQGRSEFSRDEWIDVILRSVGLEPSKISRRVKLHFIARLAPLAEPNFNFIELGPRSTGKSYFFSEFSPYSTLVSGGQATKAVLFYNNARRKVGLIGFWDTVAFDEVAGIRVKDSDAIQILKDFMANGRFSRGVEVIANASLAFVGNIDLSVEQVVNSTIYDLFQPLPPEFDLAIMDRFACYLPGWEMPKNSSEFLTNKFGFITDYLCEAFHHLFNHSNRYEEVSKRIRLGSQVEGRDEKAIKKTICGFLKVLHPAGVPSNEEFEEYVEYAVECRRRIKEQMNKRKPDDEFAKINLSFFRADGTETIVWCPESRTAEATQHPSRKTLQTDEKPIVPETRRPTVENPVPSPIAAVERAADSAEKHFTIFYGDTGHSYDSMLGDYLANAKEMVVEDPYVRLTHQVNNFVRLCEAAVKRGTIKKISLVTSFEDEEQRRNVEGKLADLAQSLLEFDIVLDWKINSALHDREIRLDNGWIIKIGRGLDIYQKPQSWFELGASDLSLRKCLETKVDIYRAQASTGN
jgi:ATP-dependent Lon protease